MDNFASINAVDRSLIGNEVLTSSLAQCRMPCFEDYCFTNIPDTVLQIFGSTKNGRTLPKDVLGPFTEQYDNVVMVLFDAFGWNSLERYRDDIGLLRDISKDGMISKITSQFPSTTTVHISTIHSGEPVTQHGLLEWFCYNAELDRIILPLRNMLVEPEFVLNSATDKTGVPPERLYPAGNVYSALRDLGVKPYSVVPQDFMESKYNQQVFKGVENVKGDELPGQLANMTQIINSSSGKNYFYVYSTAYDYASHEHGFGSDESTAIAKDFFEQVKAAMEGVQKKTLLLVTADHGMRNFKEIIYLDEDFPEIRKYIRNDADGRPMVLTGGSPDWFLFVTEPETVKALINERYEGKLLACTTDELIDIGVFGHSARFSSKFVNNLPDLIVLSISDSCARWAGEKEGFTKKTFVGCHGGLTPEEMDSILLAIEFGGGIR